MLTVTCSAFLKVYKVQSFPETMTWNCACSKFFYKNFK